MFNTKTFFSFVYTLTIVSFVFLLFPSYTFGQTTKSSYANVALGRTFLESLIGTPFTAPFSSLFGAIQVSAQGAAEKPNIVYIMLDDVGYGDIGAFGGTVIDTPNIDAFASQGKKFTNFYTNAPVCSPTRVSILTGQYQQKQGFWHASRETIAVRGIPPEVHTLPEMLKQQGYTTAHVGKWHIGILKPRQLPPALGFDWSVRMYSEKGRDFYNYQLFENDTVGGVPATVPNNTQHLTEAVTDRAVEYIRNSNNGTQPFFLNIWYLAPHKKWESPPEWVEKYEGRGLSEGDKQYAALLSFADHQVGRVLTAIDEAGIADNTLVIITSDNGPAEQHDNTNSTGGFRGFKGQLFDGGIHVPFMARWNGMIPAGTVNTSVGLTMDLMQTLGDITGAQLQTDGISLVPALLGSDVVERNTLVHWENKAFLKDYVASPQDWWNDYAVLDKNKKLVHHKGTSLLFDLAVDPFEQDDIAALEPETVTHLEAQHSSWRKEVGEIKHQINDMVGDVLTVGHSRQGTPLTLFRGGYITLEPNDRYDFSVGDFSFITDIKFKSVSFGTRSVIAKKKDSWRLTLESDGRIRLWVFGDSGQTQALFSTTVLQPDIWYRIAFSVYGFIFGDNNFRLYIDGNLEANEYAFAVSDTSEKPIFISSLESPFFGRTRNTYLYGMPLWESEVQGP